MRQVRVWALESDLDAEVVNCLANKLVKYFSLDGISIQSAGKSAIASASSARASSGDSLRTAVQNFLMEDACVIFVIDSDGPMSRHQRSLEPNSLFNQIQRVLKDDRLRGRVFLSMAVQEIESWVLVDCLGIFCYFANDRKTYRTECRGKVAQNKPLMRIVRRNQKGDTENIVEAEIGGKGPKEYLEEYSKEILLGLNPSIPRKNVEEKKYKEKLLPGIAKFVVIDGQTLNRNRSLRKLGTLLRRFG